MEFNWPAISVGAAPAYFIKDTLLQAVTEDTATPANNEPLPTALVGPLGSVSSQASGAQLALDVGVNVAGVQVDPRDIRALTASDIATVEQGSPWLVDQGIAGPLSEAWPVQITDGTTPAVVSALGDLAVSAKQTGSWDIANITGTVSLPTGAATEATLASLATEATLGTLATEATLATIATNTTGLDTLARNAGAVSATTLRVKLSDEDSAQLAGIESALPASLGQQLMAASLSVTLASDQPALPVTTGTPAPLTVKQAAITVGTTAVRLTTDGAAPATARRLLRIQPDPNATGNFFYGSSSVSSTGAARGCQIFPAQTEVFENDNNDFYIISDTAAQTVFVVEVE